MTLEDYFREVYTSHMWVDHAIRCSVGDDGVTFYIHAYGKDSPTLDFVVTGNMLIPKTNDSAPEAA